MGASARTDTPPGTTAVARVTRLPSAAWNPSPSWRPSRAVRWAISAPRGPRARRCTCCPVLCSRRPSPWVPSGCSRPSRGTWPGRCARWCPSPSASVSRAPSNGGVSPWWTATGPCPRTHDGRSATEPCPCWPSPGWISPSSWSPSASPAGSSWRRSSPPRPHGRPSQARSRGSCCCRSPPTPSAPGRVPAAPSPGRSWTPGAGSCGRSPAHVPASSARSTRNGGASNATCTTAPSSASWRST